ncbi:hypothetical protein BH11MYX4_BH11MYX4_14410 [soil metagenome]
MTRSNVLAAILALTLSSGFMACASPGRGFSEEMPAAAEPAPRTDFAEGGASGPAVQGHLRGIVRAPHGTVPVAGALLYLTKDKPASNPTKVYCDECVHLAPGSVHALSDATGAYDLPATETGTQYLVIQKGGFRRVREIYVSKGDVALPDTLTTLPPKTDVAAGDEVPRMTVVHGQYDEIEASLQKLGIDPSAIEIVQSALIGVAAKSFLSDAGQVNGRHIVFLPCGDYTQPSPNTDLSADPQIQDNLRAFVEAGGRLYVTDWHYDFIARTFPGKIGFAGASASACSGCGRLTYDAAATVTDPDLSSWMSAQNLSAFTLQKNYTEIDGVTGAKVWVSGSKAGAAPKPATVSFEQGCGRVLFSTYHTEPFATSLTPQERALLGVLLEVSVCNASPTGVVIK